jgi:acetyl-CoA acetyltransferase
LLSKGHPLGATGLAQCAELVWQLRGEAGERQVRTPRVALAQNSGGWLEGEPAACNVHILERLEPWA